MGIGKTTLVQSAICTSDDDRIVVRGHDLASELIGKIGFVDLFHLLLTGRQADAAVSAVLNATLVAIAEHGMTPSVQAARMTYAAAPEAMQGAVAAGINGCGSVILGASELAGQLFVEIDEEAAKHGGDLEAAARSKLIESRAQKRAVPGYGHPQHKARDRRVDSLFSIAEEVGLAGRHVAIARAVEAVIPDVMQKPLRLNVSGAIPAVLLDAGFPAKALRGIPILARTASLIAHLNEEMQNPMGFVLTTAALGNFEYTGDVPLEGR